MHKICLLSIVCRFCAFGRGIVASNSLQVFMACSRRSADRAVDLFGVLLPGGSSDLFMLFSLMLFVHNFSLSSKAEFLRSLNVSHIE